MATTQVLLHNLVILLAIRVGLNNCPKAEEQSARGPKGVIDDDDDDVGGLIFHTYDLIHD